MSNSNSCINFRDIGEFVNLINTEPLVPEGKLFRGGKTDFIGSVEELCSPATIINLRRSEDKKQFNVKNLYFPIPNNLEVYETGSMEVKKWLNTVIRVFENKDLSYPVFIHCNSGKDRTGVVVAALLKIAGIPEEVIIEEYLLSEGDVRKEWISKCLEDIGDPQIYFNHVDIRKVKGNILRKE